MTETQISVPCCRCGMPAAPHGEHHHREGPGPTGKGMGGAKDHDHLINIPTCRTCHDGVHRHDFRFVVNGEFVSTVSPDGKVLSERAMTVNDQAKDSRYWSDEHLAVRIAQALERAGDMVWEVMRCTYEWQRRYGYGERWAERLVQFVRDYTGQSRGYSVRQIQYWAEEWPLFKDKPEEWKLLSGRIAHTITSDDDPEGAIEMATVARLDGKPVAAVVETLRERQGRESPETHECPECGAMHRIKKGA